jgi:DNA polymerase-4
MAAPESRWGPHRAVIHLDLDAFYASVEQRRRPELRGRPVIVGGGAEHDPATGEVRSVVRRGVVSAASYEARRFGVHSAMPLATALRLCPQAVLVPVDFAAYRSASSEVFGICRDYTPVLEPLSLDEAYLDVGGSIRRFGEPDAIAAEMVERISTQTGLDASVGVATGKTVAKIASDLRKPRGFVVVRPGTEAAFLHPLPLRRLPGLGPATERALAGLGVTTLGGLAGLPPDVLRRRLGEAAATSLSARARGEDPSEVTVPGRPKSISREETFLHDTADPRQLDRRIRELAADVGHRLRAGSWSARTVSLRLRSSDFTTITRQRTLPTPLDDDVTIAIAALELLGESWDGGPLRLLGVGVEHLAEAGQLELLGPEQDRASRLDRTLDALRSRFGDAAVRRGAPGELRDLDARGDDLRRLV